MLLSRAQSSTQAGAFRATIAIDRRTDLDWLRIGAFGLLILFHIGMFYVPWEWEVKSPRLVPWLEWPMEWTAPWRLLLLFVVSGAATRFMSARLASRELWTARSRNLLPPLLFAVLFVVPPQAYFRVIEQFDYHGSFAQFWLRYLRFDRGFCHRAHCLVLPNWNHMWFVVYLWIYTTLLVAALIYVPALLMRVSDHGRRWLVGWRLLALPALVLGTVRIGLAHFFPETHGLVDDWYLHAIFFLAFLFGFLFISPEEIWRGFGSLRWISLAAAVLCYGLRVAYTSHYRGEAPIPFELKVLASLDYGLDQWAWIAAALGFARKLLAGRDGPARRYLTEAVFPYFIVHQTAIIVVAHELVKYRLPLGLEVAVIVVATLATCALTFEAVRRVPWLRPWFGLKRVSVPVRAVQPSRP